MSAQLTLKKQPHTIFPPAFGIRAWPAVERALLFRNTHIVCDPALLLRLKHDAAVMARRQQSTSAEVYCSCCLLLLSSSALQDSIIFGADTIDTAEARAEEAATGATPLGIGRNSQLVRAIVDSNARIGANCVLTNKEGVVDGSNSNLPKGVVIKDGILVVMRGAVIPPGTQV
jgi:hypothetical protein